jgi:hypothetical protein
MSDAKNNPQVVRSLDEIGDLGRPWWLVPEMPVADDHEVQDGCPPAGRTSARPRTAKPQGLRIPCDELRKQTPKNQARGSILTADSPLTSARAACQQRPTVTGIV